LRHKPGTGKPAARWLSIAEAPMCLPYYLCAKPSSHTRLYWF